MMSVLIVIAVLTYAVKVAFTDGCYAVRGQVPPRIRARMAQAARDAANGGGRRVRYGFGDYFSDLWDYAFTALRARQRRKLSARTRYGLRGYLSDRWEHAWEDAARRHNEHRGQRPVGDQPAGADLPHDPGRLGRLVATVRGWTRRGGNPELTDTPAPEPAPAPAAPTAPAAAEATNPPASPAGDAPDNGGQRLAPVIPINSHTKEEPMSDTTPTGEVTGLATAHLYAAGMSNAFADQAAHTEQFMANLTANQVSGDAVAAAAQAQELSNAAAAAWAVAQEALGRHMQVAEAYAANPDAGSKEFVTAE